MNFLLHQVRYNAICSNNATWKQQAITVAGSPDGITSLSLAHLKNPNDILIDPMGNLLIADSDNNRIVYWLNNATQGRRIAGTGAFGSWINLFKYAASIVGKNKQE
jgi:hypothetical protein